MKPYPAVVYAQTAIVAAVAIAKEVGSIDRISTIEIATSRRGYEQAGRDREKWTPENRDTADHSLPYITARAMFDGDINNGSYTAEKLRDPRLLALMGKITVKEDPEFAKPKGNAPPTRLTVTLDNGQNIIRQIDDMPGFPGQAMNRTDIERKFRGNVGSARWPSDQIGCGVGHIMVVGYDRGCLHTAWQARLVEDTPDGVADEHPPVTPPQSIASCGGGVNRGALSVVQNC